MRPQLQAFLAGMALLWLLVGCVSLPPPIPTDPVHAEDDYLAKTQERTFREFLVGPANLRETGVPPSFQEVAEKSSRKFVRGVANIATGWVEIPKQTYNTWYKERTVASPFVGLGKGVLMAVSREVVGVGEVILPFAPAPADWAPLITPEFVFQSERPKSALTVQKSAEAWNRGNQPPVAAMEPPVAPAASVPGNTQPRAPAAGQ